MNSREAILICSRLLFLFPVQLFGNSALGGVENKMDLGIVVTFSSTNQIGSFGHADKIPGCWLVLDRPGTVFSSISKKENINKHAYCIFALNSLRQNQTMMCPACHFVLKSDTEISARIKM